MHLPIPSFLSLCGALVWRLAATALVSSAVVAQCATTWRSIGDTPFTNGDITSSTRWDADGPGPAPDLLVVAGYFSMAGSVPASGLAAFDEAQGQWTDLGVGSGPGAPNGLVTAVGVLGSGELVVGGQFSQIGGVPAACLARWDGSQWQGFGSGLGGGFHDYVQSMTTLPDGSLVVSGVFTTAGGLPANRIARWQGGSWSPLGSGLSGGPIPIAYSLVAMPNGDLIAGGAFTSAGGVPASAVARWDGVAWSPLGAGVGGTSAVVRSCAVLGDGSLVVGGSFSTAGGLPAAKIARWAAGSWSSLGAGVTGYVTALLATGAGGVEVGGSFTSAGQQPAGSVARWDSGVWSTYGPGLGNSNAVATFARLPSGRLFAGGSFNRPNGAPMDYAACWNGSSWVAIGPGLGSSDVFYSNWVSVTSVLELPDGDLILSGDFNIAGGVPVQGIARLNRQTRTGTPLGGGLAAPAADLALLPNGHVVAAGVFGVKRWDGVAWADLGAGAPAPVATLAVLADGRLVAGGTFLTAGGSPAARIAVWNGSSWGALGAGVGGEVTDVVERPNGELVVAGTFTTAGGSPANGIARWNGSTWLPCGTGLNSFGSLKMALAAGGDVYVVGSITAAGGQPTSGVVRWDGVAWHAVPNTGAANFPPPTVIAVLPDGDLLTDAADANFIGYGVRYDGSTWSLVDATPIDPPSVMLSLRTGEIAVGVYGGWGSGFPSPGFMTLTSSCPATASHIGTACTSSVGPMQTTSLSLPWLGSICRTRCSGFAPGSLGFGLLGFASPGTPLSFLHPAGVPGCALLASPDASVLILPTGSDAEVGFGLPTSPVFAGLVLHLQVLQAELDPNGLTRLAGSDGLQWTIGLF